MNNIEEIKKEIVKTLAPLDPERIILFGSYANGTANEDSDIDLYVVTKDDYIPKNFKENSNLYLSISKKLRDLRAKVAIDLIVHTKSMSEKFIKINSSFSQEILSKGKILL
jgi:predicted nucleotidyltransferase